MTEFDLSTREGRWKHFGSVDPVKGTKPTTKNEMTDLQSTHKNFLFKIEEVGIKNLTYPVLIDQYQTAGLFSFSTSLNKDEKGINMSRILESVEKHYDNGIELEFNTLYQLLRTLQEKMNQHAAGVDVSGKWFFDRFSPVTSIKAVGNANVTYGLSIDGHNVTRKELTVEAAVTTLCPCSKEISEYSAHNQRGIVTVKAYLVKNNDMVDDYKDKILDAMEANASSVLYPILKRPDEKRVTERAYENPRFVEDLIRLIAADLVEFDWIEGFDIECRNEESIHQHDAFARLKYRK
ncbi:GTP cyclohydrolase I FolE2 [Staphylococcus saccharolyticus]|uniref:GTP cyclohydrolase FolE2 n=1 Tax=Staphylococcus saccharolyticus TaxID=33028 RepID=UPI00102DF45A|nr:GTP cyclohydrolase FolE2 [Staphylococcus saccharolyticus]MBL7572598.1 GTP cyclohydrolase I FolE2 [Staphylococcus saccharolyticus]MBL7584823.1 GTP cyclohydrolase I FolE2 [Staphylococcus saccharolyticus]MBL7638212.1 GTP cyclohydrolase I FolE2 [Staphylococcus saccharolyticus]QRJ68272.1 GTP cyclohydrolase I FolE2 [Staphylococcus saccharolyticus]TAA93139.1 GTP cyclohydrolase I FolE2 [Staphylococcus saccharolyticus]